ncbi:MAG: cytidylate kinase-like family protein [Clostridia bacterium]|nr:cytidylate kinase-like family protein [Clostridia bacterium]
MKRIITISREFGSGGRSLGKQLAEKLGWKYYDKELVKQVAEKTGFDPAYIEEVGEHSATKSPLSYLFSTPGTPGVMKGMSAADFLWIMQRNVIVNLVKEGPCVIVGRCADYILRDRDDVLNVFVHAPIPYRAERIVRLYGESEIAPEQRLKDKDKRRSINYKHYTNREWGMSQNYHLSLDTSVIPIEKCVEIIEDLIQ